MVLLARDTPPAAPGIKDLNIDMTQWQPLIEDRAFVAWLVKVKAAGVVRCGGCVWWQGWMSLPSQAGCRLAPARVAAAAPTRCHTP